jgi:hypothetical protein
MLELSPRPDPREEIRRIVIEELGRFRDQLTEALEGHMITEIDVTSMITEALEPVIANIAAVSATPITVINNYPEHKK